MADTNFVNGTTLTDADFFNDINRLHYTILGDPADLPAVKTVLGISGVNTSTIATAGTTTAVFGFDGGGASSAPITLKWQKLGNFVTLNLPAIQLSSGTGSALISTVVSSIPASITPAAQQDCPLNVVRNNGAGINTAGIARIGTNGGMTIFRDSGGTFFTDASSCGTQVATTITYYSG